MDASCTSPRPVQPGRVVRESLVAANADSRPTVRRVGRISGQGVQVASNTTSRPWLLGKEKRRKADEKASAIVSASQRKAAADQELNRLMGAAASANRFQSLDGGDDGASKITCLWAVQILDTCRHLIQAVADAASVGFLGKPSTAR